MRRGRFMISMYWPGRQATEPKMPLLEFHPSPADEAFMEYRKWLRKQIFFAFPARRRREPSSKGVTRP